MPINKKSTSKKVAKVASKELKDPKKIIRSIGGSGVSQVDPKKETTAKTAKKASKVLKSPTSTKTEKETAGSVLGQTPSKKKPVKKSKK